MGFKNKKLAFVLLMAALVSAFFLNLIVGGSSVGIKDLFIYFTGGEVKESVAAIITKMRIPRALVALMAGATLAASGTLIKAVMKNPLADSGLLGIQSGATVVAMVVILVLPGLSLYLPIASFLGGLLVYFMLTLLSLKDGLNPMRLVLSGVAINGLMGSIIGIISIYNSDKIQGALSWLNRSLAGVKPQDAKLILFYGILAILLSFLLIGKCNLLLLDDTTILNLGENLPLTRFIVASISVLLASVSVAVVGIIGFVGLVVPHISRLIIGQNHKYLLPFSILMGGVFVLLADGLQKWIFAPMEIPVGIILSFVGAPFFLYLLNRQRKTNS